MTLSRTHFLRQSLHTCVLALYLFPTHFVLTYLFNYVLTHSHTHLVKYIHTRCKFDIEAYQGIAIYYIALSL